MLRTRDSLGRFKKINLIGKRFGILSVVEEFPTRKSGKVLWVCRCDCGKTIKSQTGNLFSGNTKSCGCGRKNNNYKHGERRLMTPEYAVWVSMKNRCANKNNKYYGGKGISVCERWVLSFVDFLKDMGRRPSTKHTIERRDGNGDYAPRNCMWATKKEQANNRKSNRMITIDKKTKTLSQWCDDCGVKWSTARARIDEHGWDIKEAFGFVPRKKPKQSLTL